MARLIAKQALRYASRDLAAGEEFDSDSDSDAHVLRATGKAEDAPGATPGSADPQEAAADAHSHAGRRGRHNRRDMRAQD